jgi:hypothetical protein
VLRSFLEGATFFMGRSVSEVLRMTFLGSDRP